jgi:hypothetical protein
MASPLLHTTDRCYPDPTSACMILRRAPAARGWEAIAASSGSPGRLPINFERRIFTLSHCWRESRSMRFRLSTRSRRRRFGDHDGLGVWALADRAMAAGQGRGRAARRYARRPRGAQSAYGASCTSSAVALGRLALSRSRELSGGSGRRGGCCGGRAHVTPSGPSAIMSARAEAAMSNGLCLIDWRRVRKGGCSALRRSNYRAGCGSTICRS